MTSLNRVTLIGVLGKDPQVKSFSNGGKIITFSMATQESWKDKTTGAWKKKSEWHNVSVQNTYCIELAEKNLSKGSKVYVEGQLKTRKWTDNAGKDNFIVEVVVPMGGGKLVPIGGAKGGVADQGLDPNAYGTDEYSVGLINAYKDQSNLIEPIAKDLDDDIPF